MKNIIFLFFAFLFYPFLPNLQAREKSNITLASMREKGNSVIVMVSATSSFKRGGNVYVLHIGSKTFTHAKQQKINGKGTLTYYISLADFNTCIDGTALYLTYGFSADDSEEQLADLAKDRNYPCWSLGRLSKSAVMK